MEQTYGNPTCPECGTNVDEKGYILECEYCLSKTEV